MRLGFGYREGLILHTVAYGGRLDRAPHLVRRDGGALPRPDARPLAPHRLRHRRVGPRLHDDLARARLRLPRRDPLPRRRAARLGGRAADGQQRDLHPRGGQRGPLEARGRAGGRRGAPHAQARRVLPRHGGQLRVPRLLALLPGRQHRVRGARHRDHGDHAVRRGRRRRRTARSSTRRPTRRSTSTSSPSASTWRSTARRTPSSCPRPSSCRSARTTRTASRSPSASCRCAPREGFGLDWSTQRAWKVANPNVRNKVGTPVGLQARARARAVPPMLDPSSPVLRRAAGASGTRCGSPRTPATSAGRAASS